MISFENPANSDVLQQKKIESFLSDYNPHFFQDIFNENIVNEISLYVKENLIDIDHLSIIGLGGSSLGTKALVEALDLNEKVSFFDNVDAFQFAKKIKKINLSTNHWLVISKSGRTQEVMTLLDFIVQTDSKALDRLTVITSDDQNPLRKWADSKGLPLFFISDEIGGRFSVFTAVALLPMIFLNQDLEEIKRGINWAFKNLSLIHI